MRRDAARCGADAARGVWRSAVRLWAPPDLQPLVQGAQDVVGSSWARVVQPRCSGWSAGPPRAGGSREAAVRHRQGG
eukprot:1087434-Prymnesium_polylepis.1